MQLFEVPQTSDDAPQGIVKGTIAKYYTSLQKPTPSDIGAYTKAETDQKIAAAITNSTDLNKIYPVGMVTLFASNVNPNVHTLIVSLRQPLALTTVLKPLTLLVLTPTQ